MNIERRQMDLNSHKTPHILILWVTCVLSVVSILTQFEHVLTGLQLIIYCVYSWHYDATSWYNVINLCLLPATRQPLHDLIFPDNNHIYKPWYRIYPQQCANSWKFVVLSCFQYTVYLPISLRITWLVLGLLYQWSKPDRYEWMNYMYH